MGGCMDWKDIITIAGLVVVIGGWFYSKWKDRKHEIFRERLKRRLEMYDSVIDAIRPLIYAPVDSDGGKHIDFNDEMNDRLREAHLKISIYGYSDEISAFQSLADKMAEKNGPGAAHSLNVLTEMLVKKIRTELGY